MKYGRLLVVTLIAAFAFLAIPSFASPLADKVAFFDQIPGMHRVKYEETNIEVEKEYTVTDPAAAYKAISQAVKKNGWRVVYTEEEEGCAGFQEFKAVKDRLRLSVSCDNDDGVYKVEVELKKK